LEKQPCPNAEVNRQLTLASCIQSLKKQKCNDSLRKCFYPAMNKGPSKTRAEWKKVGIDCPHKNRGELS